LRWRVPFITTSKEGAVAVKKRRQRFATQQIRLIQTQCLTGYMIRTNNTLIVIDGQEKTCTAGLRESSSNRPSTTKGVSEKPLFNGPHRSGYGSQHQSMGTFGLSDIDSGSIQNRDEFVVRVKDRGACTTQVGVSRAKMLRAVDENWTLFNDRSSDSVGPLDVLGPNSAQPDAPMFELLRLRLVATMLNGDSFAIAQQNDVIFLSDNGIKAVDLFPRVEKDVTHWLLEEGELGLGDDVRCSTASGIDMVVAAATSPGKGDFTVRLNGAFLGECRLD
jgi:hypothetical protein